MKISIITITYNSEKVISKTIESVLEQNYRPLEYILVDGNSKDETVKIINDYLPRLKSAGIEVNFKSEPDKGISDAFNKGIKRATGDIIGITNADDTILPGMLNFVAEKFPTDVDVFYGNILWKETNRSYVRKSSSDLSDLKYKLKALHPAVYIKKSAYDNYGIYDTDYRYCMDKELLARFQRLGARFQYTDTTLVAVAAGGVSDKNIKGVIDEGIRIAEANGVAPSDAKIYFKKAYFKVNLIRRFKRIPGFASIHARIKGDEKSDIYNKLMWSKPWIYDLYRWNPKADWKYKLWMRHNPKYRTVYLFRKCQVHKGKRPIRFFLYRYTYELYSSKYGVDIGTRTKIGPGFIIRHIGGIAINRDTVIGKDVEILQGVTIGYERRGKRQGNPTIGDRVWIGSNATIVGNVRIGDDVLIAAGAFVNFDVPDHSIVIGNPGRIISKENATDGYIVNTK